MSIVDLLKKELIHPDALLNIVDEAPPYKGVLILTEPDNERQYGRNNDKLTQVQLINVNGKHTVAFKLDTPKLKRLSNYINPTTKHLGKGCDALIVTNIGEKGYILICELKSRNFRGLGNKFLSSKAFWQYVEALLDTFYADHISLENYQLYFILFCRPAKFEMRRQKTVHWEYIPKDQIPVDYLKGAIFADYIPVKLEQLIEQLEKH